MIVFEAGGEHVHIVSTVTPVNDNGLIDADDLIEAVGRLVVWDDVHVNVKHASLLRGVSTDVKDGSADLYLESGVRIAMRLGEVHIEFPGSHTATLYKRMHTEEI